MLDPSQIVEKAISVASDSGHVDHTLKRFLVEQQHQVKIPKVPWPVGSINNHGHILVEWSSHPIQELAIFDGFIEGESRDRGAARIVPGEHLRDECLNDRDSRA